jgi:Na+-driven multidrug efflux pump
VIGRMLGVEAMSAYGLASPIIVFFNAVGTMISVGAQVVTGKAIGKGDQRECRVCFSSSLIMSLVVEM